MERDGVRYLQPELVLATRRPRAAQGRRRPRCGPPPARPARIDLLRPVVAAAPRPPLAVPARAEPPQASPRWTVPSASTRKFGLRTKSHRNPSGSATHALTPPHSRSGGPETCFAPAASAAAYSRSTSSAAAPRCGRATSAAPAARGPRRRTRSASRDVPEREQLAGRALHEADLAGEVQHGPEAEPVDVEAAGPLDVAHAEGDGGDVRSGHGQPTTAHRRRQRSAAAPTARQGPARSRLTRRVRHLVDRPRPGRSGRVLAARCLSTHSGRDAWRPSPEL